MVFPDLMAMVDCWGFRTLPGPALRASDKRASPESFSKHTGKVLLLFFSHLSLWLSTDLQQSKEKEIGYRNYKVEPVE